VSDTTPGNEVARRTGSYGTSSLSERQQFAQALAGAAELLPQNYWTKPRPNPNGGGLLPSVPSPHKVLFMLETAAMLGIPPMAGLTSIHIIEGKPTLSASLWASLAREAGHRLRVWVEGEGETLRAVAELVRKDDPDFTFRVVWSHEDARKAGLLGKDNWKKYERGMLKSRAITEVVREGAPEVGMGAAYSPEELRPDMAVGADGNPVELQQVPEAHYTSDGDGTEPPRQQRQAPRQAPIVDPQAQAPQPAPAEAPTAPEQDAPMADPQTGEVAFDWTGAVIAVRTKDEAASLYQRGVREGKLNMPITIGNTTKELGALIIEIGQAFAEKEKLEKEQADAEPAVEATVDEDDEGPAVLVQDDPNIQDADEVNE
jgi:hypothetical protein